MTLRSISFDTLANGTSATSANTGIDNLNKGTGSTATIRTATPGNGLAYLELAPASGFVDQAIMNFTANNSVAFSFKVMIPNLFSTSSQVATILAGGVNIAQLQMNTSGGIGLYDAASTRVGAYSSAFWNPGTWYRVDITATIGTTTSNGTLKLKVFAGDDNTTALFTTESSAVNTGTAQLTNVRMGRPGVSTDITLINLDSIEVNDGATAYIGPWVDTVSAGSNQTGLAAGATATITASAKNGVVSWVQTAGSSVILNGTGLSRTFTVPSDGPSSLTFQATSGAATSSVTVGYTSSAGTVGAGPDQTNIAAGDTVTLTATATSGSATWAQLSGTPVTLLGIDPLIRTFTAPWDGPGTLVFAATSSGVSDNITISYNARIGATVTAAFDTLADGAVITTANSGMSQINNGPGSTTIERTATPGNGSGAIEIKPASGAVSQAIQNFTANNSVAMSVKVCLPSNLSSSANTFTVQSAGSPVAQIVLTASGQARVSNAVNALQAASATGLFPAGTWMRVEMLVVIGTTTSNGVLKVKIFSGDSSTPSFVTESIAQNVGTAQLTNVRFGRTTGVADSTAMLFDSFQMTNGAISFIGPFVQTLPTANAGPDQSVNPADTVTLSGSGTNSPTGYIWAQISGTSVTLTGAGATRTFPAPPTATGTALIFSFTASNASGNSAADTIQVNVSPQIEWIASSSGWQATYITNL